MKPYILNYSETIRLNYLNEGETVDTTYLTDTVEPSDNDEIRMAGLTEVTKTIEPSDEDRILSLSTSYTFTVESSDDDSVEHPLLS